MAWQGWLCHAQSDGNRVSFARPDQWLPDWAGVPHAQEAARVVIPAYLRVFGPATPERFDAWLTRGASKKAVVRSWFADLEDRLARVEVDGEQTFLLAEDVEDLGGTSPTLTVRLLPAFDQYVLGPGTKAGEILAASRRAEVSRTAGWISPVVVAGGRVAGIWEVNGDTGKSLGPASSRSELGWLTPPQMLSPRRTRARPRQRVALLRMRSPPSVVRW